MAGLDPAIHVFIFSKGVDTRVELAHDDAVYMARAISNVVV